MIQVYITKHLTENGTIDVNALQQTLAHLFENRMTSDNTDPSPLVARHILECFKSVHARMDEGGYFDPWVSKDAFWEYLSDLHVPVELPEPTMIQLFEKVAKQLSLHHLAVIHHTAGFSNFAVHLKLIHQNVIKHYHWCPEYWSPTTAKGKFAVRFPYDTRLFQVVEAFFRKNVPPEFWLEKRPFSLPNTDSQLAKQLEEGIVGVENEIATQYASRIFASVSQDQTSRAPEEYLFFLLLEEWLMAKKLSQQSPQQQQKVIFQTPIKLQIEPNVLQQALVQHLKFVEGLPQKEDRDTVEMELIV